MWQVINDDFRNCDIPNGLVITDPPYNQGYSYNSYKDRISEVEYIDLLSKIPTPCVIIHYPEETINLLPKAIKAKCEQVVCWVYNSNTDEFFFTIVEKGRYVKAHNSFPTSKEAEIACLGELIKIIKNKI